MFPTSFNESNHSLSPPLGMTEDQCESLATFQNGELVVSCWKPTEEELQEIIRTKRVWLIIWGRTMPPAYVGGISPFPSESPVEQVASSDNPTPPDDTAPRGNTVPSDGTTPPDDTAPSDKPKEPPTTEEATQ